jgi:CRISPR-associated endonuclease/helicase Cas3
MELRAFVASNEHFARALGRCRDDGSVSALPVSTLRGQFADNRNWLEDPSAPAIIIGTVDKIGSKLLFEGYGTSYKMRPYHAALLGHDSLIVLDESHLVPPFEQLVQQIAAGQNHSARATRGAFPILPALGPTIEAPYLLPLRVLSLSATSKKSKQGVFTLDAEDRKDPVVRQRIFASKRVEIHDAVEDKTLPRELATKAWALAEASETPIRCIIFCNRREHAESTKEELLQVAKEARAATKEKPVAAENVVLFVGARRFFEREREEKKLEALGFVAGSSPRPVDHAFLIATSAGEVGVDLDADHMVADLVAWERMVQRLGRVNRRGKGDAHVHIFPSATASSPATDASRAQLSYDAAAVRRLFESLPIATRGGKDASPAAVGALQADPERSSEIVRASTASPLHPGLTRPLVESWALTSMREHTGRPEVAPWLRGWVDEETETSIVWRQHVSEIFTYLSSADRRRLIEATPIYALEKLEIRTSFVVDWLLKRAQYLAKKEFGEVQTETNPRSASLAQESVVALLLDSGMELVYVHGASDASHWTLQELAIDDTNRRNSLKRDLERQLGGATLIIDAKFGGLSADGLLDAKSAKCPPVADSAPAWAGSGDEASAPPENLPWRVRLVSADGTSTERIRERGWRERVRLPWVDQNLAGADTIEKWCVVDRHYLESATEDDRSTGSPLQTLAEHQSWAADCARRLCQQLEFPTEIADAIICAARLHDEGKRAATWQRAFSAPTQHGPYAKTPGPLQVAALRGYRHEFGSLPYAEADSAYQLLSPELKDLVLHLIAAHHGGARPNISSQGCEDAPPSRLVEREQQVALRYERLQQRYGPWGLAYLESILRAADQQASRANDEGNEHDGQG